MWQFTGKGKLLHFCAIGFCVYTMETFTDIVLPVIININQMDHDFTIMLRVSKSGCNSVNNTIYKQEHPRGSIVEPLVLHQDVLNSLFYNGLKTPIIVAHVYESFQVGSRFEQNHIITRLTHRKSRLIIIGPIHMKS